VVALRSTSERAVLKQNKIHKKFADVNSAENHER